MEAERGQHCQQVVGGNGHVFGLFSKVKKAEAEAPWLAVVFSCSNLGWRGWSCEWPVRGPRCMLTSPDQAQAWTISSSLHVAC